MHFNQLKQRCISSFSSFKKEGDVVYGLHGTHIFIDNGGDVLMTAHLDTVANYKQCKRFDATKKGIVKSRALDDRLGAHILLDILPTLGINVDILLTEGEESGQSTAQDFIPTKNYNWLACFDRLGNDAVTYRYSNVEAENALVDVGFKIDWGSYTDICELTHLGIWGVNIGTGYFNNHEKSAWADLNITKETILAFRTFWEAYHDTPLWDEEKQNDDYEWTQNIPIDYEKNAEDLWETNDRIHEVPPDDIDWWAMERTLIDQ